MLPHFTTPTTSDDKQAFSRDSPPSSSSTKSLTPQRKHRKLMKDGTSEVWPESVEKIFVDGLREYWNSPWATYSRGRSRWRNQFLVDYLHKANIERSKKQVASHIQVLRNMWKGEPEFHLVAGGEELFQESGLLAPVKKEDSPEMAIVSGSPYDDSDSGSPSSPSSRILPYAFPFDRCVEVQPSSYSLSANPGLSAEPYFSTAIPSPLRDAAPALSPASDMFDPFPKQEPHHHVLPPSPLSTASSSPRSLDYPNPASAPAVAQLDGTAFRSHSYPSTGMLAPSVPPPQAEKSRSYSTNFSSATSSHTPAYPHLHGVQADACPNRVTSVSIWTENVPAFTVRTEHSSSDYLQHYASPLPSVANLRIKLYLPPIEDVRTSPTLHGFNGAVTFAAPWAVSAQCLTSVFQGCTCVSEETASLQAVQGDNSNNPNAIKLVITAFLPESALTRSRWLDSALQTTITQQITVDNEVLAIIHYDMDRRENIAPSAELLLNIQQPQHPQHQRLPEKRPAQNSSLTFANLSRTPSYQTPSSLAAPRSRDTQQPSLSCALSPLNARRSPSTAIAYSSRVPQMATCPLF